MMELKSCLPDAADSNVHTAQERLKFWVFIVLLFALSLLCFSNTLGCYFLSDDLLPVSYMCEIFNGHPNLLMEKLSSPWQDKTVQLLYRPLSELTFAIDYFFWQGNAFGYHLTNLLFHALATVFLFLLVGRLLYGFNKDEANTIAFFSAAMFAVSPLHNEAVSWIIGRVDVIATTLYLCSFWLFLKVKQDRAQWAYLIAHVTFIGALLAKELAITLPVLLIIHSYLNSPAGKPWYYRLFVSFRETSSFWLLTFLYFIIRSLVLGTIIGGYIGSLGDIANMSFLERWIKYGSLWKIVYPYNEALFSSTSVPSQMLHAFYFMAGIHVLLRIPGIKWDFRVARSLIFVLVWFLLAIAPTYQAWFLSSNLAGSRHLYLASCPLCLLVALTLLSLPAKRSFLKFYERYFFRLSSILLLTFFVFCCACITYGNNIAWIHASEQSRKLRAAIVSQLKVIPDKTKLVVLNLPQSFEGAHMFYSFGMLKGLLQPPLTTNNLSGRVSALSPCSYCPEDLGNLARLQRMSARGYAIYYWDTQTQRLTRLEQFQDGDHAAVHVVPPFKMLCTSILGDSSPQTNKYLIQVRPAVATAAVDFVEVKLISAFLPNSQSWFSNFRQFFSPAPKLVLSWAGHPKQPSYSKGQCVLRLWADSKPHLYRFPVSQYKSWLLSKNMGQVCLTLPSESYKHSLLFVRLINGDAVVPKLSPDDVTVKEELDGVCRLQGQIGSFKYDASKIPHAASSIIEVSKPNCRFEDYSGSLRDPFLCRFSLKQQHLPDLRGIFKLQKKDLPAGRYQVRIGALSANGELLSTVSDPLTIDVN